MIVFLIFRGAGPGCNTREISDKLVDLKRELERLEDKERELDEQRLWVQQSLKNVSEDPENEQLAYVTYEDVCRSFRGDTLLVVQAPSGTQLEVPIPETVSLNKMALLLLRIPTESSYLMPVMCCSCFLSVVQALLSNILFMVFLN